MSLHRLAGQPAPREVLPNIPRLVAAYYINKPDPENKEQLVSFGTSGHRGSSLKSTFTEDHILAIAQAICDVRKKNDVRGPLFLGIDTHALSEPAWITVIEVLAANEVTVYIQSGRGYTPTPVISHAILTHSGKNSGAPADGIVITPSHNPPEDGGIKYNPPTGGPADTDATKVIQELANGYLKDGLRKIKRTALANALKSSFVMEYDYVTPYVDDLRNIVDMQSIASSGLRIGTDPLGGSGIAFWAPIADRYGLNIEIVNEAIDPTFSFMTLDKDGKIRMDCSSPYAMAGLIDLKDRFDISFGNDPDFDRHGIVTKSRGLMNPNHYLSVAVHYLFSTRTGWSEQAAVGKTLVSSSMIDKVSEGLGRKVAEVPVGFKWFVDGLLAGSFGFGGEESAGASFLRHNGSVWTTDKDGFIMNLLAAEITAVTGKDPGKLYSMIENRFGSPLYERIDAPADPAQKKALANLSPEMVTAGELAGEKILAKLTRAPWNNAKIGGLKVVAQNGWFAARPSGTEDVYKIYAESFLGSDHLKQIQTEAQEIVGEAFRKAGG